MAILALLPALVLLIYIYKMDRVEKEPPGLLIGLFFIGVVSVVPAVILELLMERGLLSVAVSAGGMSLFTYQLINNFICVALVEEFFKWLFTFLITRKSKNFNCVFDGVVYTVFVSLGFAAAENLLYVFQYGFGNAILRMLTAVPAHCFFGVIMGYFYSKWFLCYKARALEKHLRDARVIPGGQPAFKSGGLLALSIIIPALAHGFYDFCATMDALIYTIAFVLFLIFLYIWCFRSVYKLSKQDTFSSFVSMDMVLRRYPEAIPYVSTMPEFAQYFAQPIIRQPAPMNGGQPFDQTMQGQPMNGQPFAQPMQGQPMNAQPFGQPMQGQPMNGQPFGQPMQGQPMNGQPFGQPMQGQRPSNTPVGADPVILDELVRPDRKKP